MGEFVRVEVDEAIATIRLDRPKMNALNAQVQREFIEAARQVGADDDVRAAVIPKPVIAAITGYALGGGLEVALCADFRVAGEGAKVGQPEIQLGIIPGAGGTQRLARLIGPAKAKDLVFSGRHVAADEALRIGLVDLVVPDADVYSAAREWAGRYRGAPAVALRAAKQTIDAGLEVDLRTGLEIERLQFAALFATEDQTIGMRSFMDSGPGKASFVGR